VRDVALVAALAAGSLNVLAALFGAWRWWQVEPSRAFWVLARAGQLAAVAFAGVAGVLALRGLEPADGLFWLYAVLPVAVGFFAEQLRIASAATVLEQRGLEDAQAVGRLPEREQRSVVLAILRREMGVATAAAATVAFLALRAALVV
jgi:hypothetical protein